MAIGFRNARIRPFQHAGMHGVAEGVDGPGIEHRDRPFIAGMPTTSSPPVSMSMMPAIAPS